MDLYFLAIPVSHFVFDYIFDILSKSDNFDIYSDSFDNFIDFVVNMNHIR